MYTYEIKTAENNKPCIITKVQATDLVQAVGKVKEMLPHASVVGFIRYK